MSHEKKSVALEIFRHLMGLVMFAMFGWLLYEFGDKWNSWIIGTMILAILIFAVLIYAPSMFKPLLEFLKPISEGAGKAVGNATKDEDKKPEDK